jgi:hypothetical protein
MGIDDLFAGAPDLKIPEKNRGRKQEIVSSSIFVVKISA